MKKINYSLAQLLFTSLLLLITSKSKAQIAEGFGGLSGKVFQTTSPCTPAASTSGTGTSAADANTITATDKADKQVLAGSCNQQSCPHISIDKQRPCTLIVSANILTSNGNGDQGYYFSTDAGQTWTGSDSYPGIGTYTAGYAAGFPPNHGMPCTAFDAGGNASISTLSSDNMGDFTGFYLISANDATSPLWNSNIASNPIQPPTWSSSAIATSFSPFNSEKITADDQANSPYANNVYCVGTSFTALNCSQSTSGIPTTGNLPFFSKTSGSGIFTNTVTDLRNSGGTNGFGFGANVQTGPNGEVYVCWAEYSTGYFPANNIGFAYSADGGSTWTSNNTALNGTQYSGGIGTSCSPSMFVNQSNTTPNGVAPIGIGVNCGINNVGTSSAGSNCNCDDGTGYIAAQDYAAMAVDKSCGNYRGRIYLAYADNDGNGNGVIQVSYSDDNGTTWTQSSSQVSIFNPNINGTAYISFSPWIAVDDVTGIISVVYSCMDGSDANHVNATNTYVAYSSDGGNTFTNIKVSDVSHLTAPIPGYCVYAGYYTGITAHNGKAYATWADNRINSPASSTYDINDPSLWQVYVSEIDYTIPSTYISATAPGIYNVLDVNGNISIPAASPLKIYQAESLVVVPYTNNFQTASGSNVIIRAGVEVNLTNNFSAQNEMHAYLYDNLNCSSYSPKTTCGALGRLSASNNTGRPSTIAATTTNIIQKETKLGNNIKLGIFPNPSSGVVYIDLSTQNAGNLVVNLGDATGKQLAHNIYTANEGANSFKLDLSTLNSGVYFINITDENGVTIKNDKLVLMGQ